MKLVLESNHQAERMVADLQGEIARNAALIDELARSSAEQSVGASQVNLSLQKIGGFTQQNALASQELVRSSRKLFELSAELAEQIRFFKTRAGQPESLPQ